MKRWALGLHTCSQLVNDVSEMKENDGQTTVTVHKKEMPARKQADAVDREKLRWLLDPLQPENHPNGLVNIVIGRLSPDVVNVDTSVSTGVKQMKQYKAQWTDIFNKPPSKEVVTMAVSRRQIKVGQKPVYNTRLMYSRVLGLQKVHEVRTQPQ